MKSKKENIMLNRDDILKALEIYDEDNIIEKREPKKYFFLYKGKEYFPKVLVELAYKIKYNKNWKNSDGTKAKNILERNGFDLYYYGLFKQCLKEKYNNEKTIRTYLADLKKAIKALQTLSEFENEKIINLIIRLANKKISKEILLKGLKNIKRNDKKLYQNISIKAFEYLECLKKQKQQGLKMNNKSTALNQILYGPPGTGKTYSVIERALEIIYEKEDRNKEIEFEIFENEEKKVKASYEEILNFENKNKKREYLKGLYEYHKENGQIEFITFHQSYSYEEFVEGIKPCDLENCDSEKSEIKYHIEDGIFKEICKRAEVNYIIESPTFNIKAYVFEKNNKFILKKRF